MSLNRLPLLALLLAAACTPGERATAATVINALAPLACGATVALVSVYDGPDEIARLCDPAAHFISGVLAATVHTHEKGAAATCTWEPLARTGGRPEEQVCREARARVESAMARARAVGGAW